MTSQGQFLGQDADSGGMLAKSTIHQQLNMESDRVEHKQCGNVHVTNGYESTVSGTQSTSLAPVCGHDQKEVSEMGISKMSNSETAKKDGDTCTRLAADMGHFEEKFVDEVTPGETPSINIVDSSRAGGMKTRGNRRPILLTERMRQKRQTLQDMAKPLKAWLYKHRDNPYPTKTEKVVLAVGSQMTLVQVSNWFANARRRLKNTVRQPGLSWSKRIKMYNSHVSGNAERLSISSTTSSFSDLEFEDDQDLAEPIPELSCYETTSNFSSRPPSTMSHDADVNSGCAPNSSSVSLDGNAPHKLKHSILNRYLNDSFEHAQKYHHQQAEFMARRRNGSGTGSVSSYEYEDVSLSRLSPQCVQSRETSLRDNDCFDDLSHEDIDGMIKNRLNATVSSQDEEDTYWKEINAALALTNMARACRQQLPIVT